MGGEEEGKAFANEERASRGNFIFCRSYHDLSPILDENGGPVINCILTMYFIHLYSDERLVKQKTMVRLLPGLVAGLLPDDFLIA